MNNDKVIEKKGNIIFTDFSSKKEDDLPKIIKIEKANKQILGKITKKGIEKIINFSKEAIKNANRDPFEEWEKVNDKKEAERISEEHPDNIPSAIKEINKEKPLSIDALRLSGTLEITKTMIKDINLYNHKNIADVCFLFQVKNNKKNSITEKFNPEKSLEGKLIDYKKRLKKMQEQKKEKQGPKKV